MLMKSTKKFKHLRSNPFKYAGYDIYVTTRNGEIEGATAKNGVYTIRLHSPETEDSLIGILEQMVKVLLEC